MRRLLSGPTSNRVIVELLRATKSGRPASINTVASHSRCSSEFAREVLAELGVDLEEGQLTISTGDRLRLAIEVSRRGALGDVARALDWREFEMFTERCLAEAGYGVKRDIRVTDGTRSWQIDVLGLKAETALCFDCKHWSSPSYPSKLEKAAEHQAAATRSLLQNIWKTKSPHIYGLPIVLTLFDPRQRVRNGVVLLSIRQLPDFLGNLAVYSGDLPYITSKEGNAENPIKEPRF